MAKRLAPKSTQRTKEDGGPDQRFADTPQGWARRWTMEFKAARSKLKKWHEEAEHAVKAYTDDVGDDKDRNNKRLTLYTSNVQTQEALLYGKTPAVDVDRRHDDSSDDAARVGGELLGRLLNCDIERDDDSFQLALQHALSDRLIAGMGNVRMRYVAEFEDVPEVPAQIDPKTKRELAPAVPATKKKSFEDVETDYVYWKDQLWSPCRTHHEKRWHAFKALLGREALVEKFGERDGGLIPLNAKRGENFESDEVDATTADPWGRAEVWEIWDKEHRAQWFFVEGFDRVLVPEGIDAKPNGSIADPLGLKGFWPFPRPLLANATTSAHVPRSDYRLARSLYEEINKLTTRIDLLEDAVQVSGVYDGTNDGLQRLLSEGARNKLIPVKNWSRLVEKGGLEGAIQWMPIEQIVNALSVLEEKRASKIGLLYQISGLSDIMRGGGDPGATATQEAIKARFGSVRMQRFQDEFARFASDAQRVKAEIISRHFEPETIYQRANAQYMGETAELVMAAIQLIKSQFFLYRIQVRPESVSLTDYAALKQERTEVVAAVAQYLQVAGPLAQQAPPLAPYLLQILQWMIAGLRGASSIEGVLDQAISAAQQAAQTPQQPPPPDPKLQAQQLKSHAELAKSQLEAQNRQREIAAETVSGVVQEYAKAHGGILSAEAKERAKGLSAMNAITPGPTQP